MLHFRVDVETRVSELAYFLSQKLNSLSAVTEYHDLVDFELRKQRVQTVELFLLLQICVVLGHSFESKLLHKVYEFRLRDVLFQKRFY